MGKVTIGYTDNYQKEYPDIKVTSFDSLQELRETKLGKAAFINTHNLYGSDIFEEVGDVVIYRLKNDPTKAYRLYKDLNFFEYAYHGDECQIVQELTRRQENISLTEFPTGVVSVQNPNQFGKYHIVGQEIPFYENHINIGHAFDSTKVKQLSQIDILKIYKSIIAIFKELRDNEIIYNDIHRGNVLLNLEDLDVKLIDFENTRVSFSGYDKTMIENIKHLYRDLNSQYGMDFKKSMWSAANINEISEFIEDEYQRQLK